MLFWMILCLSGALEEPKVVRPVHTYSIVAYDAATGEVGGAVQSHWFSVGSIVIWAEPGVGAVATQSLVNPDYGPMGLQAMADGKTPEQAMAALTAGDSGKALRQVAMVDTRGNVAGFTGDSCIDFACDLQGDAFSVQANIMLKDTVCAAMKKAFEASKGKPLARRLLAALEAAQGEGGDLRGKQSAAIKVVKAKASAKPWRDVSMSLRVEDHPEPVAELARLIHVHEAYEHMNKGDEQLEHGKVEAAMASYGAATKMLPKRVEPIYWQAVNLVNAGRIDEALPLLAGVYKEAPDWRLMADRLAKSGLLPKDPSILERVKNAQ